jgi:hypothetical protein
MAGKQPKKIPYLVVVEDAKAAETINAFMSPDASHPVRILLDGTCPRCDHHTDWSHELFAAPGVDSVSPEEGTAMADTLGVDLSSGSENVHARCDCKQEHPTQPDDDKGCGARFSVNVEWP